MTSIFLLSGLLERKSNLQAVNIQEERKVNPIAAAKPFTLAEIQEKISHMPKVTGLRLQLCSKKKKPSPGTLILCNPGLGLLMCKVIHHYALGSAKAQPYI